MAQAYRLDLLLALLLPVVGALMPGTVVRLNEAVLSYGKRCALIPGFNGGPPSSPFPLCRIQTLNVHVPHFHLKFIADFGVRMLVAANFTFKVFRVPEPLKLVLPVVLLADAQVAQGSIRTPVVSISACFALFNSAAVLDAPAPSSPASASVLPQLCLSISNLVQGLNVHLGTLIGLNPVGPESQIRYSMTNAPNITKDYISLDISAILFLLGKPIVLPVDVTHFVLPPNVGADGAMATVGLSQDLFDSALLLLQKAGALNLDITGQLKSEDNLLNTSVLGQLIPEVARRFPEPMPVTLKVRLGATPVATLRTNNATLQLQPFVEVQAVTSNSAFQSLFSFDVVSEVGWWGCLGGWQLPRSHFLPHFPQLLCSIHGGLPAMRPLMDTVFKRPLLDHLNALLGMGITLPSMVNLYYINPEVFVYEGYVVISSGLLYQR
uniref:BPI fold containing family B member 2 n=1 Tax=Canis lupus dingo TaxID=286419 RepID=A0A8C0JWF7_CANLU